VTDPIDLLLPRLSRYRKVGPNRWMACCPLHEDRTPSLSIREEPDGAILLWCFSCNGNGAAIIPALGLDLADLFPPRRPLPYSETRTRQRVGRIPAQDALQVLERDAFFVYLVANALTQGEDVRPHLPEVEAAMWRISAIRESWMAVP